MGKTVDNSELIESIIARDDILTNTQPGMSFKIRVFFWETKIKSAGDLLARK